MLIIFSKGCSGSKNNHIIVKRHDFIYEPERPIPKTEAVKSLVNAEKFVRDIMDKIQKVYPQKNYFVD